MSFKLQQLSITLFVKDLKPAFISPNALQYTGVIPADWKLSENPVYSDRELKLNFINQVSFGIQPNRIILAEIIDRKSLDDVLMVEVINNYLQIFSKLDYQAISIAASGYCNFQSQLQAAQYMSQQLLGSKPWSQFEQHETDTVSLKLGYPYKSGNFYLNIDRANLKIQNNDIPAVWFAGSFNYPLIDNSNIDKMKNLQQLIQDWQIDVNKLSSFIEQKFLASQTDPEVSVFATGSL